MFLLLLERFDILLSGVWRLFGRAAILVVTLEFGSWSKGPAARCDGSFVSKWRRCYIISCLLVTISILAKPPRLL